MVIQRPGKIMLWLTAIAILLLAACVPDTPPTLNSVSPATGYPRQLLAVSGDITGASVVWDVGLPTEQVFTNGLFGTSYFQIPANAAPGAHPVAMRRKGLTSSSLNVTVLAASGTFPTPRIEDFSIWGIDANTDGTVNLNLIVTAANMDIAATITLNGGATTPVRWGGLPVNYLLTHVPNTFGYPIYHYLQHMLQLKNIALGSALNVTITNTDGRSVSGTYTLPAAFANIDSDGDGLLDTIDGGTFTAPSGNTIDLAGMGTNKWHKDILVEVDWVTVAQPDADIWAQIEAVFDNAPVLNPDSSLGVNIIIDRGQGGAFTEGGQTLTPNHTTMDFGTSMATGYVDFFTYKNNFFNADRLRLFHYGIFGRARPGGSSGRGEIWGNDFMVTFATFGEFAQELAQNGTFVHELGHNLGLTHGGHLSTAAAERHQTMKPNFPSTMSYRWQFPAPSTDCNWTSERVQGYSSGSYLVINEPSVNENNGICDNTALDMNNSGTITSGAIDTNGDGATTGTFNDQDQWGNLELDFDATGSSWESN